MAQSREKALRDAWNREEGARAEGLYAVVMTMPKEQFSIDQISRATGYSVTEVERMAAEQQPRE